MNVSLCIGFSTLIWQLFMFKESPYDVEISIRKLFSFLNILFFCLHLYDIQMMFGLKYLKNFCSHLLYIMECAIVRCQRSTKGSAFWFFTFSPLGHVAHFWPRLSLFFLKTCLPMFTSPYMVVCKASFFLLVCQKSSASQVRELPSVSDFVQTD